MVERESQRLGCLSTVHSSKVDSIFFVSFNHDGLACLGLAGCCQLNSLIGRCVTYIVVVNLLLYVVCVQGFRLWVCD